MWRLNQFLEGWYAWALQGGTGSYIPLVLFGGLEPFYSTDPLQHIVSHLTVDDKDY